MKKISIIISVILLIIFIFFTVYGERIYNLITPKVSITTISTTVKINDNSYFIIPKSSLTDDDCVFLILENQGFSRILYTVQKKPIQYIEDIASDNKSLYVISGIKIGDKIISQIDKNLELNNNDRVIIK